MAATSSRIAEITPEIEAVAQAAGCELVHAELKGGVLRLFVDKPEGVTLADCEHVSKLASAWLDVVDFGKSRYLLEVSSPGLDRLLVKARDYARFVGRKVRVTIEDPETRRKKMWWPHWTLQPPISHSAVRVIPTVEGLLLSYSPPGRIAWSACESCWRLTRNPRGPSTCRPLGSGSPSASNRSPSAPAR